MTTSTGSTAKTIGFWVFKILLAIAFVGFGALKLIGVPMLVHEFDIIGLGQGFRYVTGVIEVGGAIAMLIPASARFGSVALLCVSVGAFVAQATRLHGDVIHTLVLIVATGVLAWLTWRPHLTAKG